MTLVELQDKLGEQVLLLTDPKTPYTAKKEIALIATTTSSLAKQMINNADVILRTEKLVAEGKMVQSSIVRMIKEAKTEKPNDPAGVKKDGVVNPVQRG